MQDPYSLNRFVQAQAPVFDQVVAELRAGAKRSHWMWFIFPQLAGLGHSDMAMRFAIRSMAEAQAYLRHPVLGMRLVECTQLAMAAHKADPTRSANDIFGSPDDLKFRSSMTLFAMADPAQPEFGAALALFFDGRADAATVSLLDKASQ
ncbi:DUF1810 domain-containing protein [Herbaspirillum sp. YR522]|uniref:DUF1810 domain-containing protein n=1 Tax=Herbaspirillum sp. YR522 TaxID=1144342 RepID=UPI00026F7FA5|nr:hypothetical protein PMI40_03359 [Herbaspirillum sp. YR522]